MNSTFAPTFIAKCAAIAIALVFLAASPARAEDEDECDAVVKALQAYGEKVMKTDPKTPPAICAGIGQMLAYSRAIREVADQCMDEGKKRDALMKDMGETVTVMQQELDKVCK